MSNGPHPLTRAGVPPLHPGGDVIPAPRTFNNSAPKAAVSPAAFGAFNCKCPGVSPSVMSLPRRRTGAAGRRLSECRTAKSGDRCAPRRSRRANIHLGSGSTNVPNRRSGDCCAPRDRVGLTYTKWWRHSRACSDMCNERAPAPDSTKPTSRARHKTDALRLEHASCFKRREGNLLPRIPQRHTMRVFKTKARSLLLFRRVRFVRAPDPPHYK